MEKYTLNAKKRTIVGRKVKQIRKAGNLPANIYGKKVKSQSIEVSLSEFEKIYKKAHETGLVELMLDSKAHPVLIHNIQYDPVKMTPLHADFFQVDLHEKVAAKVPVILVGDAPAVSGKAGVLLTLLDQIEVEALPADLPEKIEIKVDGLSTVDQAIKVADIKLSDKIKIITVLDLDVVKVAPLVSKEAEKLAAEEEAAKAAAAAEAAATTITGEAAPTVSAEAPAATPMDKKDEKSPPSSPPKP